MVAPLLSSGVFFKSLSAAIKTHKIPHYSFCPVSWSCPWSWDPRQKGFIPLLVVMSTLHTISKEYKVRNAEIKMASI